MKKLKFYQKPELELQNVFESKVPFCGTQLGVGNNDAGDHNTTKDSITFDAPVFRPGIWDEE